MAGMRARIQTGTACLAGHSQPHQPWAEGSPVMNSPAGEKSGRLHTRSEWRYTVLPLPRNRGGTLRPLSVLLRPGGRRRAASQAAASGPLQRPCPGTAAPLGAWIGASAHSVPEPCIQQRLPPAAIAATPAPPLPPAHRYSRYSAVTSFWRAASMAMPCGLKPGGGVAGYSPTTLKSGAACAWGTAEGGRAEAVSGGRVGRRQGGEQVGVPGGAAWPAFAAAC